MRRYSSRVLRQTRDRSPVPQHGASSLWMIFRSNYTAKEKNTKPGTDFMTAYRQRPDSPTLKLTRSWVDLQTTSPAISEFRAHAFQAAVSKARELGWIV